MGGVKKEEQIMIRQRQLIWYDYCFAIVTKEVQKVAKVDINKHLSYIKSKVVQVYTQIQGDSQHCIQSPYPTHDYRDPIEFS